MIRTGLLLTLPALVAAAQPELRNVSFVTPDGYVLKGTFSLPAHPGPRPVVLLAHQFMADRAGWKPLVDDLNARGIATLALDLRGHGQSTQKNGATVAVTEDFKASRETVGFDRIPADLLQAAQWVRKQPRVDGRRLALAGSSIGAYCVLIAAPQVRPVAVLALSPAGGWGENPDLRLARAAEQARTAVFVMASEDDAAALASALALKPVTGVYARIRPGKDHGFQYFPALTDTMGGWLAEYLTRHPQARAAPAKAEGMKIPTEEVK